MIMLKHNQHHEIIFSISVLETVLTHVLKPNKIFKGHELAF